MKKIFAFTLSLLLTAQSFSLTAVVREATGKIQRNPPNRENVWEDIYQGSVLYKGDTIMTGFKSYAKIEMDNGTVLQLSSLSKITIEQMVEDDTKTDTQLFLELGTLKAKVSKTKDRRNNFRVQSPVAVASVRGTEFLFSSNGELFVFEGTVFKSKSDRAKPSVSKDSKPNPPPMREGFDVHEGFRSPDGFDGDKKPEKFDRNAPPDDKFIRERFINPPPKGFKDELNEPRRPNFHQGFRDAPRPNDGRRGPPPPNDDRRDMAPPPKNDRNNGNPPPPNK